MFTLTKRYTFEASHQLKHHDGKCARLHGHSWAFTIRICGLMNEAFGAKQNMVMDYGDISAIVKPVWDDTLDHHHLNDTLGVEMPTSEYVARYLFHVFAGAVKEKSGGGCWLDSVTVEETCTSSCTYQDTAP